MAYDKALLLTTQDGPKSIIHDLELGEDEHAMAALVELGQQLIEEDELARALHQLVALSGSCPTLLAGMPPDLREASRQRDLVTLPFLEVQQ